MNTHTKKEEGRFLRSSGFTIVELLIVIVIIGILAALVIVAYRGLQQKANNTDTLSVVNSYIKSTKQYAADNNKYPEPSLDGVAWSCLGNGYPSNTCLNTAGSGCSGLGGVTSAAWYNDAVKTYAQNKTPPTNLQTIGCSGGTLVGAAYLSNWPATGQAGIFYSLNNDTNCASPGGITGYRYVNGDGNSGLCYLVLNKPY